MKCRWAKSSCYCQSGAVQDSWATVFNAEERSIFLTLPNFCSHASHHLAPAPVLSCGRNTGMTTHEKLGYGLCSFVSGQNNPLPPHTHLLQSHSFCVVWIHGFDQWCRQERKGRWRVAMWVTLLLVNPQFSLSPWTPSANLSSFPVPPTQCYPNQWPRYPSATSSDTSPNPSPHSGRKLLLYILRVRT